MNEPQGSAHTPVVVVLGAGAGGRGVAEALTGVARLVIVDRDLPLAQQVADAVAAAGGAAQAESIDLTDLSAVEAFRDSLVGAHGGVDAVIHLVGGWRGSPTVDAQAIDNFNALMPGVVTTVQTTSVAFREALMASPQGRYVMVTSTAVAHPTAGNAGYVAAKAAAQTWVMALGDAFRDTSARAVVLAVKALVDPATRAANPDKQYAGYTGTDDLGAAVARVLSDASLAADAPTGGVYIDLTKAGA